MRRGLGLCAAIALLASPAFGSSVSVEVIRGFQGSGEAGSDSGRVELLVDLTGSMNVATPAGPPRVVAARAAAMRLLESLPSDTDVGLHTLVPDESLRCTGELASSRSAAGHPRAGLLARARGFAASGEASLAEGVTALRERLASRDGLVRTRVVLFSDLGGECGGDLCEVLSQVVAGGASVDVVVLAQTPAPSCLERFVTIGSWRPKAASRVAPLRFEIESGGRRVVEAVADGSPVAAPAGPAHVVIDLSPPLRVGPLPLAAGERGRLRVLDFPALDPPVREWFWSTEPDLTGSSTSVPPAATTLRHGP